MDGCVPLRVRSYYSLLSGASSVGALIAKAARSGTEALALTDENNLYGAVEFSRKAREAGIRPILGAIIDGPEGEFVLLVRDAAGYANLCRIVTARHLDAEFSLVRTVAENQAGLCILASDAELLAALATSVDRASLRAEILRPARSVNAERQLVETARALGVRVVASCDVFFADDCDYEIHEALTAMKRNALLEEVQAEAAGRREGRLRSPGEMARLFRELPGAVSATLDIAEACRFDILSRRPVFPRLPGDSASRLRAEALEGARSRYGTPPAEALARLERELDLIVRKGFADYFLVVADIVRHARSLGTPVAGRGSGASSLVAYCLGVTNVDPIRFRLPFERFLNKGRADFPDLDVDFCWRLRDDVISYVYRRYGDDHVAMVSTYATMQPRLAFREAAKALGLSNSCITEVARRLERGLPRARWDTLPAEPETVERALHLAGRLEGFPHHLSVHCGGVVITPDPVSGHAPLQRAEKGVVVTQYDKDAVEAVGLVKLDLLGNRALSSIGEAARLAGRRGLPPPDPEALPEEDPATARLLAGGDTLGVNQLESPAMRGLLRQLRPMGVRDLMQVLALIRPGAAGLGSKETFVRRARGIEPVPPTDRRLESILGDTHGLMLYEDDALFVASALAGMPLHEADRFRRAVTKCRSDEERLSLSKEFLERCERNGADPRLASGLWVQMAKFNSYSFCRAHAASYARLAWANAHMKAHYPAEFWVAALNNNQSMYPHWVYAEEAKRAGVPVLLPCVNRSGEEFTLEDGAIRVGLGRIAGLTKRGRESVLTARPFEGLCDLAARTELRAGEIERLIGAGALDFTRRPRPEMLLELGLSFEGAKALRGGEALFRMPDAPAGSRGLRDYSEAEKWRDEWDLLALAVRRHPVAWARRALARRGVAPSRDLAGRAGRRIRVAGALAAMRTAPTGKGQTMCFVTLADEDGVFEVTLLPAVHRRSRHALAEGGLGPFVVEGRVESRYDALSVQATGIEVLGRCRRSRRRAERAPSCAPSSA